MANKQRILQDGLSNKQRILKMVEKWPNDIPFQDALYHMHVLSEVMAGIKDAEQGRVVDHDELFDELERLCDEEENQARLVAESRKESHGTPPAHRGSRRPKNGEVVHKPAKKIRKSTS